MLEEFYFYCWWEFILRLKNMVFFISAFDRLKTGLIYDWLYWSVSDLVTVFAPNGLDVIPATCTFRYTR